MTDLAPRVELKLLDPRLKAWGGPAYQTAGAAALDLHACLDAPLAIAAGAPAVLIGSGLALHLADPHLAALVLPRSGLGHRAGLVLGNGVGLIDADYVDEIRVSVWNRNPPGGAEITITPGDRIAQLMFVPVARPVFAVVEAFSQGSDRAGGFGSTGLS